MTTVGAFGVALLNSVDDESGVRNEDWDVSGQMAPTGNAAPPRIRSLEGIYPGLIMANGERAEGIEANLFFTFFGLDAIHKARNEHIKLATVGNPGLHFATMAGGLPGVSTAMTHYMNHKMEKLDIPSIPEFIEMISDTAAGLYACQASVDLFGLEKNDFIDQVQDIITVGEFYEKAAGGQIIFT